MNGDRLFLIDEIATACGLSRRHAHRRATKEGWPRQELPGRSHAYGYRLQDLPAETQAALMVRAGVAPVAMTSPAPVDRAAQRAHLWAVFDRKPDNLKEKARYRHRLLLSVEQLVAGGTARMRAIAIVADQAEEPVANIRRWFGLVKGLDRDVWLPALAPRWAGRTATAECSPEAWDFFKADWLRHEYPCAEAVYRRLEAAAAKHGWTIPSCATLRRRIERELPRNLIALARDGADVLKRMYPAQERDRSVFRALEAVNADGHKLDIFAKFEDGTVQRPVLAVWQDLYSGKILGHRIGDAETAELIRLAFADVVERFGIPTDAWFDNGRGFASKWLTGGQPNRYRFKVKAEEPEGVLTALGIKVHWTKPYAGQSKPIERAFRDFCEDIAKHPRFAGAYTGNRPDAKPENYGSKAIPIELVRQVVAEGVAAHNAREGRRAANCAGRSFDATFAGSYADALITKATIEQRRLLLLAAEDIGTNREDGSIRLYGNRYWTDAPALARAAGRKVIVRFDPQDLTKPVHAYHLSGEFIATLQLVEKAGFNDIEQARTHARARQTYIRATKERLQAERRMDIAEAAALLPAPAAAEPLPETKVVRPVFSRLATAAKAEPAISREEFEEGFSRGVARLRAAKGLE